MAVVVGVVGDDDEVSNRTECAVRIFFMCEERTTFVKRKSLEVGC
jgi:hypothetical protein